MTNGRVTNARSNYWVFTWNNPNLDPDEFNATFDSVGRTFLIFQRERGENGTEHYQGYLELQGCRGFNSVKAINPQIHWEVRRGTQAQAIEYARKDDTRVEGPWQYGTPKRLTNTGCSPDFLAAVKEGKRVRALHDEYPDEMRKYPRYYESLREVYPPPVRDSAPEVTLLIGEPGAGKTRWVREREEAADLYVKPCDRDFWMNGYDGHPAVLLDDFAGAANHVTLTNLLQLLDRYQIRVSTKHGHTWWQPKRIYITTNIHPANWYSYKDRLQHYDALERRFTKVRCFPGEDLSRDLIVRQAWDEFWKYESHVVERAEPLVG